MAEMRVPEARQGTLQDVMEEIVRTVERGPLRYRARENWPPSAHVEVQTRAQQQRAFESMMKDHMEAFRSEVNRQPKRDLGDVPDPRYAAVNEVLQLPVETEPRNKKVDPIDLGAEQAARARLGAPITPTSKADLIYDKESTTFETKLNDTEEVEFQKWKKQYAPKDSGHDYDLRGAFKAGLKPDSKTGHWPDTFKKPNHPTFSNESKYAKDRPDLAGHWEGDKYVPPKKRSR